MAEDFFCWENEHMKIVNKKEIISFPPQEIKEEKNSKFNTLGSLFKLGMSLANENENST